jgi:branched-chain amino acid transport system permease protein
MMVTALLSGLVNGAAYALFAMGIVIVYKNSRTFNLAQGEFATVAAYVAYVILKSTSLPYSVALIAALVAAVAMALAIERLVIWPLRRASRVDPLVATAAITSSAIALETILSGGASYVLPAIVGGRAFTIGGTAVSYEWVLVIGVVLATVVLGGIFFSNSMNGIAIRAAASEPTAARIIGIAMGRASMLSWGIAGLLGGLGGILLAPVTTVSPGEFTASALVAALTATVLGGLTSIVGACVGGLVIGVAESLSITYIGNAIPGAASLVELGIVLIVLLVRPSGLLGAR